LLQSREFIGAGLTPENILSRWLDTDYNSENIHFIQHHIVKTSGTLIIHLSLPLIYLFGYSYFSLVVDGSFDTIDDLIEVYPPFYYSVILATLLVISAFTLVYYWSLDSWEYHPFVKKIKANLMNNEWTDVVNDINTELRRPDKFIIQSGALNKVIVSDNWIIKVGQWPWKFNLAHKSNVQLELIKSVHMALSPDQDDAGGGVQYLSVKVHDNRVHKSFEIRLKSTEYRELETRVRGTIGNVANITIYKNVSERFLEVFREHVEQNPTLEATGEIEELEPCIGCMSETANIKLVRRCNGTGNDQQETGSPACETCYCRPMWCLTCLGKWFAMRQDKNRPDTWLSSKCPCPTCRSKFCLLDVSLIS